MWGFYIRTVFLCLGVPIAVGFTTSWATSGEVVGALVIKPVDPAINEAALATVRTWKFKVTRGEQAGFPIKFLYRLSCDSSVDK
jgi:hypothetical protein